MTTVVLHVFGSMDVGGAELRTIELAEALDDEDFEFHYLALSGRAGSLAHRIESRGGHIHPLRLGPRFPLQYARLLRELRPDVIDSHVATFSGAVLAGAAALRVPRRIAHFRSDGDLHGNSARRRLQRRTMRYLISRCATSIVGVSPGALSNGYSASWRQDDRARVIPNGFSVVTAATKPEMQFRRDGVKGDLRLIHVGRPSAEKNRSRTISILREVRAAGFNAHLTLVGGKGADEAVIADAVKALKMAPYIDDAGHQANPQKCIARADCLILTSTREGLPGVVLESLAVGTPALCSDVPGAIWIADYFPSAVRTMPLSAPDSEWVTALQSLLSGAPERHAIVGAFADTPFSLSAATESHRDLYLGTSDH
ncbi:glycosyltransferase [Allobranchiibius sp. GilTou73]|uniref:glycosyltransferase n=1 Tax=Allobranchiibius sp. GilTou73 TaxID=2904523 RepID=UPI001F3144B2|nr:glycosyltransferase [Allobranchiibius sp. GilTou73]UIJ36306.1 glycosyltransferase [Allobranchiibius sp. GilTou73]